MAKKDDPIVEAIARAAERDDATRQAESAARTTPIREGIAAALAIPAPALGDHK